MSTEVITKERPILFSGPMVWAILDGRKTVTRRLWKMPPGCIWHVDGNAKGEATGSICDSDSPWWGSVDEIACPHGSLGDRLWVRESLRGVRDTKFNDGELMPVCSYAADGTHIWSTTEGHREPWTWKRSTLPSIHMPRWACRIVLEIVSVRVERLQEITEEDAAKEGMHEFKLPTGSVFGYDRNGTPGKDVCTSAAGAFATLWTKLNGRDSWHANPWVWRIEFKRINNFS